MHKVSRKYRGIQLLGSRTQPDTHARQQTCNGQEIEDFAAHCEQHPHEYELLAVEDLG